MEHTIAERSRLAPRPLGDMIKETARYVFLPDNLALAAIVLILAVGVSTAQNSPAAPPACGNPTVKLAHDYAYVIGSADFSDPDGDAESGSHYRWLIGGTVSISQAVAEGLLLHLDNAAGGANGESPTLAQNVAYTTGKWGQALALPADGKLEFAREHNLDLAEGAIEMWVALRADGNDPVYADHWHPLFHYRASNGDYMVIAQSENSGVLYGGGVVNGQWQSAYGSRANMREWKAGEWHHLAFAYSASGNWMRFYVDGVLVADTNEGHYWPPASDGNSFVVGGDIWNTAAYYALDEVRLSGRAATGEEIAARARRMEQPRTNEIWLATAALKVGDSVAFEYTPATITETGAPCQSAPLIYPGIPVTHPQPPSTLLPPDATTFTLAVQSLVSTTCAYAVGAPLDYPQMTPFTQDAGAIFHRATVGGLNPDPNTLNDVYVRCASHPDYVLHLHYRSLSRSNPRFPRTGNLWGWWEFVYNNHRPLEYLARIDLWLGAGANADEIRQLRQLNPDIRVLTSINAVENNDLDAPRCNGCASPAQCDSWYLKDVNGNKIEVWPGSYRINLTHPAVAEYQACYAYQTVLDTDLMADGVFFDNVMTTMSWLTRDIYGNPVQIDANQDGLPDDPDELDTAWKAGVFHELETFRQLMPHALVNGHSMSIYESGIGSLANGVSLGFATANVLEGETPFVELWNLYHAWYALARPPAAVMFESSPPDQIAYGYDYEPWTKIPTPTLEFARTYYPYVRFGLALTLMNDGYFAHEYGDTWHGNDWWYDELDFDLGYPLGPAGRVDMDFDPGPNRIENGGFEDALAAPWSFWANSGAGCHADVSRDTTHAAVGAASARIVVTATSGIDWHVDLAQRDRTLDQGASYDLSFWAKSDRPRSITLGSSKGSPDWRNYGLWERVPISPTWLAYTVTFEATETVTDARIQFFVGEVTGTVWLDEVQLRLHPPDVFQRQYTNGLVLLNGTRQAQSVTLGPGYRRLTGSQAPMHEFILDDGDEVFTVTTGTWLTQTYDSGEWRASGPFYHAWKETLHELSGASGQARWSLPITSADVYTITAWWPAAPQASGWTRNARYEVVANEQVVVSATLDQSAAGDQWHAVGAARLSPGDNPYVRIVCTSAPCVADALHVRSAERYNNGAPAERVTLQPLDGIVLRAQNHIVYLPLVLR